jgi:hypothetical protein
MTQLKPYIVVKRLVITSGAQIAYDEKYDEGVNIIRGRNSSGKSTIADFLFFALGGDLPRLKDEAKLCDHTFLEVSLSGKVFTLKRVVQEKSRQGMDIFEGCFAEAKASGLNGWLRYPYNATEYKEGYYQAILKELGIPYSKSDDKSSITLHQILRLMYVDQMTSLDRLFKFDSFDSSNKRNAIGELLLGISDFELYGYRIKAQRVEAILDAKIRDIKTLHQFFGDEIKPVESIDEEILARRKEIDSLEEELFKDKTTDKDHFGQESLHDLRKKVFEIRAELRKLLEEKSSCSFDISDSQNFVSSLHSRLESLQESGNVISVLSDIGFHFCPACFNKVDQKIEGCKLCGFDTESEDSEIDPTLNLTN